MAQLERASALVAGSWQVDAAEAPLAQAATGSSGLSGGALVVVKLRDRRRSTA
jgi:hypothetical protein